MTFAFWVLAANLMIIALLIVIVPIWFRRDVDIEDNQQHNLDIGRQKLVELKSQRDQKKISQSEYEEQLTELELALDDELSSTQNGQVKVSQGRWIIAVIVPVLPIAAIVMYQALGTPQMLNAPGTPAAAETVKSEPAEMDFNTMLAKLVERLQQNPDDIEGWVMLGRTNMYLKKFADAAAAFAKADQLQANDANILIQYADALAMSSGGRMQGKPSDMVYKALAIEPEHTTGLWLAGMAKAESGDYQSALNYWLKLQPLIVVDPQSSAALQKLISDARIKLGQQAPVIEQAKMQPKVVEPSTAVTPLLTVKVELSAKLTAQTTPTDTVFIYAQALQGMKMPLAIVRKQVKDLPLSVTLSDAQAMSPMAKLSNNKQVKILARISKAGNAVPEAGDLLGSEAPVSVSASEPVHIIISDIIQ